MLEVTTIVEIENVSIEVGQLFEENAALLCALSPRRQAPVVVSLLLTSMRKERSPRGALKEDRAIR